jgi:hypothetical protein
MNWWQVRQCNTSAPTHRADNRLVLVFRLNPPSSRKANDMNNLSVLESLGAVGVGSLELLVICTRDVLLGCAWGVTLLGFPVALYFVGRAFWRAATWPPGQHELTAHCS